MWGIRFAPMANKNNSILFIIKSLKELWGYRQLIRQLAARDLKARYKVSVLGFFWSLLRPLLTIAVLAVIFSLLDFKSTRYAVSYPTLLLATYLPWFFFSTTLLEATSSLISNGNLVKKVYCPRAVFPASAIVSNVLNYFLSLLVLIPLLYICFTASPTWHIFQLPLVLFIHILFLTGLCFITSVCNVMYRDTTQIIEFIVFAWFYVSPVLYDIYEFFADAHTLPKLAIGAYFLNPMAGILEWYRYIFLSSNFVPPAELPPTLPPHSVEHVQWLNHIIFQYAIPYSIVISILLFVLGYWVFKKLEIQAVDEL